METWDSRSRTAPPTVSGGDEEREGDMVPGTGSTAMHGNLKGNVTVYKG